MLPAVVLLCVPCVHHHQPNAWTTVARILAGNCEECGAVLGSPGFTGLSQPQHAILVPRGEWWEKVKRDGTRGRE